MVGAGGGASSVLPQAIAHAEASNARDARDARNERNARGERWREREIIGRRDQRRRKRARVRALRSDAGVRRTALSSLNRREIWAFRTNLRVRCASSRWHRRCSVVPRNEAPDPPTGGRDECACLPSLIFEASHGTA